MATATATARAACRNPPGVPASAWCAWPARPFHDRTSIFAAQEHIDALIRVDPTDVRALVERPADQDPEAWQFEHLRIVCRQLTGLVIRLSGVCRRDTCPDMKALEWLYLCAAHTSPQSCPAIDYIVHTLDSATELLNSPKLFPSRVAIAPASMKQLQNIARRLYRIFAHTWFHHRDVFGAFEDETFLYTRFVYLCNHAYNLVPDKLIFDEIPLRTSGAHAATSSSSSPASSSSSSSSSALSPPSALMPSASGPASLAAPVAASAAASASTEPSSTRPQAALTGGDPRGDADVPVLTEIEAGTAARAHPQAQADGTADAEAEAEIKAETGRDLRIDAAATTPSPEADGADSHDGEAAPDAALQRTATVIRTVDAADRAGLATPDVAG